MLTSAPRTRGAVRRPHVASPPRPPAARPDPEVEQRARYQVLVDSEVNRLGHKILDHARELLDMLEAFADLVAGRSVRVAFAAAGLGSRKGPGTVGVRFFDQTAADAAGLRWSLDVFAGVFENGLVARPADMPEGGGR